MSIFHQHQWKETARTYAKPLSELGMTSGSNLSPAQAQGLTTILWECQDPGCRELRQEEMLGKIVE